MPGGVEPSRRTRQRGRRRDLGRQRTAERREACLPVAREGSCLASVAARVTARHVQGWTSLGAPPIPSLGGRQRRRWKGKEENPDAKQAGTEETGLFDMVNRKDAGGAQRQTSRSVTSRQRQ